MKCDELKKYKAWELLPEEKVYLKSEADKVIAEKDEEIAELKRQIEFLKITHNSCGDCNKCADGMGKVFDENLNELKAQKAQAEDDCAYWKMREGNAVNAMHETEEYAMQLYNELRHQKYKRCLAMARWCRTSARYDESIGAFKYRDWYWKWFKRWLELAKKFKEAK